MHGHHEPRSIYYDLERTRVTDGVVLRMVDRFSVFYPGQGNTGSSTTTWFDRTCRVFGDRVACSGPTSIAKRDCDRDNRGGQFQETCTGEKPAN